MAIIVLIIHNRHETPLPVVKSGRSADPQPNATAASTAQDQRRAGPAAGVHRRAEDTTAQSGAADVPEDHEAFRHAGNVLAECRCIVRQP
jgi:hypothetical protein